MARPRIRCPRKKLIIRKVGIPRQRGGSQFTECYSVLRKSRYARNGLPIGTICRRRGDGRWMHSGPRSGGRVIYPAKLQIRKRMSAACALVRDDLSWIGIASYDELPQG